MKFPSQEWADKFRSELNQNTAYKAAAQAWEGDILFLETPTDASATNPGIHLALAHGECTAATYYPEARDVAAEFVYAGTPENWQKLIEGKVDPVKAILDGTFRVKGNLAKLMRFTRAAKELVETASRVPTTPE